MRRVMPSCNVSTSTHNFYVNSGRGKKSGSSQNKDDEDDGDC